MYQNADKRIVKGWFRHDGIPYTLGITDPSIEDVMLAGEDRIVEIHEPILGISLGEIYRGHAYKLIAAVLTPEDGE